MAYTKNIWLLILVLKCLTGITQDSTVKVDTNYISDLSDKLAIRFYGVDKFSRFTIRDNALQKEIRYTPNNRVNIGIGVNYKWFGLGLAFNFPFINNDDKVYGKTDRLDAQTNIFTRRLLIDLYLQYYKGFYIENPASYIPNWQSANGYPLRPDIVTTTLGGSCIYVFNHRKYSAKAAFVQTDLQKKSAGSFLLGGFFSILGVSGDSMLLPSQVKAEFNPVLEFENVTVSGLGISFGYSHTFVMWKKFYASFTLAPGISLQNYTIIYANSSNDRSGSLVSGRFLARGALVYNSKKSFGGLNVSNDSFSGNTGKDQRNSLNFDVGNIRFFYGRRFNAGKKKSR